MRLRPPFLIPRQSNREKNGGRGFGGGPNFFISGLPEIKLIVGRRCTGSTEQKWGAILNPGYSITDTRHFAARRFASRRSISRVYRSSNFIALGRRFTIRERVHRCSNILRREAKRRASFLEFLRPRFFFSARTLHQRAKDANKKRG